MIDQWFKKDLQAIFDLHPVAVFIDVSGDAEFLLKTLDADCTVHRAQSDVEELHAKYLIEKAGFGRGKTLIYTCRKKEELKFVREYCETCGCVEIRYLQNYVKDKIHRELNRNINCPTEKLISAAKLSVGKDAPYWMNLCHDSDADIFDLNSELLPFLDNPVEYLNNNYDDPQLRNIFFQKVNALLGRNALEQPPETLARETVKAMFDGLVSGQINNVLETVYQKWLDTLSCQDSFDRYFGGFALPTKFDVWKVHIDHPFRQIDEKWLLVIADNLKDKDFLSGNRDKLLRRSKSKQARSIGINFWKDVLELLDFETTKVTCLESFDECVQFYRNRFYNLDTAIRNLYTEFLHKPVLIAPFQELYKEHLSVFLNKWFSYWDEYSENQTGTLQRIIDGNDKIKTAVIVGDGITYEIAERVAALVSLKDVTLARDCILADLPSETQNNMSRIYMDDGSLASLKSKREEYLLTRNPNHSISFIDLDKVSEQSLSGQFLVCSCKDIDEMGENQGQKALKHFSKTVKYLADKIALILTNGYSNVYLISDHGFVLTGLLSEADKISVPTNSDTSMMAERYIRTKFSLSPSLNLLELEKPYEQYRYLYVAKNISPFKTRGVYGFAHGGASPQELITPFFCWNRTGTSGSSLMVKIENKKELKDVAGTTFVLKIRATEDNMDLFSTERKVIITLWCGKKQIAQSDNFIVRPKGSGEVREFNVPDFQELEAILLDAESKDELDRTVIKNNMARDMGGLF